MIIILFESNQRGSFGGAIDDAQGLHIHGDGMIGFNGESLHITVIDDDGYLFGVNPVVPGFKTFLDEIDDLLSVHNVLLLMSKIGDQVSLIPLQSYSFL